MKAEKMEIRIVESYTAENRLSLSGGDNDPSQTNSYRLQWQPKERHVLIVESGVAVCHVGILAHTIIVGDQSIPVVGIGGLLTRPDCRGKGYGQIAMQKAEEFAQKNKMANFGLLFCRDVIREWYERLGWSQITEPVWIDQPEGTVRAPLTVVMKCFGQERWPGGTVSLGCSPW